MIRLAQLTPPMEAFWLHELIESLRTERDLETACRDGPWRRRFAGLCVCLFRLWNHNRVISAYQLQLIDTILNMLCIN